MADEEIVKWLNRLAAAHTTSEFPLILGTTEQAGDLLEVVGQWKGYKNGNIPGMVYDDIINYYNEGLVGNIITGRGEEARDKTPVGIVTHPAPLDITSMFYWTPLVAQAAELTYQAVKPAEVDEEFMREISIADQAVIAGVAARGQKIFDAKYGKKEEKKPEESIKFLLEVINNYIPQLPFDAGSSTTYSNCGNTYLNEDASEDLIVTGRNHSRRKTEKGKSKGRAKTSGKSKSRTNYRDYCPGKECPAFKELYKGLSKGLSKGFNNTYVYDKDIA
jgi:hypothetical protein